MNSPNLAPVIRDYELVEELGRGGMGVVYKARHRRLEQVVALKTLTHGHLSTPDDIERFNQEMRAIGKLNHPNIVRATDAGYHQGYHYLVMEYVDGVDVGTLLNKLGCLPVSQSCAIARGIALALAHAHQQGVIHRDIKPHNVMLTRIGEVKVLDFGLAKALDPDGNSFVSASNAGTPLYAAPEQFSSASHLTATADIYGLGGTLYKLLTGQTPYADLRAKLAGEAIELLTVHRPDIPDKLDQLVQKMLESNPLSRPGSALDIAAALNEFCHQERLSDLFTGLHVSHAPRPVNLPQHWSPQSLVGTGPTVIDQQHNIVTQTFAKTETEEPPARNSPATSRRDLLTTIGLGLAAVVTFAVVGAMLLDPGGEQSETQETANALTKNRYKLEWSGGIGELLGMKTDSSTTVRVSGTKVVIEYSTSPGEITGEHNAMFHGTIKGKRIEGAYSEPLADGSGDFQFNKDYSNATGQWYKNGMSNPWVLKQIDR